MPGMMKPKSKMKYQEGGPVRMPGKRRVLEGGEKGVPVMTPEQRRQAREAETPEERRGRERWGSPEDLRDYQRRMKKGGVVKKAKGGMIGKGCK